MDINGGQMDYLKKAFDGLESGLTRFLEDSDPDWIIYDFAPHWLPPIAARLGVSRAFFLIINAWFLAFFGPADAMISGSDYRTKPEDFMVPPNWSSSTPKWLTGATKLIGWSGRVRRTIRASRIFTVAGWCG
ncbi:hypothetical protein ACP275_08G082700 [Erythranthe tilingii]